MKAKLTITYTLDGLPGYFDDHPTPDEIDARRNMVASLKQAGVNMPKPVPMVGGFVTDTHVTVDLYSE